MFRISVSLVLLLHISVTLIAQRQDKYNESLWDIIDFNQNTDNIQKSDTMIVMATTRQYDPIGKKKFQDYGDPFDSIRYILVVKFSGRWILYPMRSLEQAFSFLKSGKDIVVYVEGMGKTFTTNLYRSAGLALQYNVNVLMFDYPTANPGKSKLKNFFLAKENSIQVAPKYLFLLQTLQRDQSKNKPWISVNRLTLFHHSMGNRMIKSLSMGNMIDSIANLKISHLVLNAACVEEKNHMVWLSKFTIAKRITINYNPGDLHLKAAQLLTYKRQLGRSPKKSPEDTISYVNLHPHMGSKHSAFLNRPDGYLIPAPLHNHYNTLFHGE